ncbi:MAG: LON peptidase substrate-binding domain-containing protein [Anaerolineae bacterium]|nr:LON peptidase substrate-binding domain-containing protein [Anaerolineae bacterium]
MFPLNTVLFPGMQLKLHIFEPRYKTLINQQIEENKPFGVVLIRHGAEIGNQDTVPFDVGCTADIGKVQRLPLGRMNIVTTGHRRFRINAIDRSQPYLVGDVDFFMPEEDRPGVIKVYSKVLRPLLLRYLDILSSASDAHFDPEQLPRQPRAIAQIGSIILQADNLQKQELLSIDSLSNLLTTLVDIYRLETMLLKVRLSPPGEDFNIGHFSRN